MAGTANSQVSVPFYQPDTERFKRVVVTWAQNANNGHINCVGNVTLVASTISTDVMDSRLANGSFIQFMPMTADALSAMPTVRVSTIDAVNGKFTILHSSSVSTTKTFRYCLLG